MKTTILKDYGYYLKVNSKSHSEAIQRRLFQLGIGWVNGIFQVKNTDCEYLLIENHRIIADESIEGYPYKEITLDFLYSINSIDEQKNDSDCEETILDAIKRVFGKTDEDINNYISKKLNKLEANKEGWISTEDRLPEEGVYVLAKHNRGTWEDEDDPKNVNCVVVKLVKGLSKKMRELGKTGKFPTERSFLGIPKEHWNKAERWEIYKSEDEHGNNKKPYCWEMCGPDSFNGQEITHWMEIPKLY